MFTISNKKLDKLQGYPREQRVYVVTDAYFDALKIFENYEDAQVFRRNKSYRFIIFDVTVGRMMDSPSDFFKHYVE